MRWTLWSCAVLALVAATPVVAWDMVESPRALLVSADEDGSYAHIVYTPQTFLAGAVDEFQVSGYGHFVALQAGSTDVTVHLGSTLFAGPPNFGIEPGAGAAAWLLNAAQYEYGLMVQHVLAGARLPVVLLAEYSRRSYHPFIPRLSEPAADHVRVGVGVDEVQVARVELSGVARFGYNSLFEFWDAQHIPKTRAPWIAYLTGEARVPLARGGAGGRLDGFAMIAADVLLLRAGGLDVDVRAELGLSLTGAGMSRVELYLDVFRSNDTEQLVDGPTPAMLVGIGLRTATD